LQERTLFPVTVSNLLKLLNVGKGEEISRAHSELHFCGGRLVSLTRKVGVCEFLFEFTSARIKQCSGSAFHRTVSPRFQMP